MARDLNRRAGWLLALLLCGQGMVKGQQTGEAKLGTPITSLPYTISAPGVYVLKQDFLSLNLGSGAAITINASDVVLDLNGHTLGDKAAGAGTIAYGVLAADQSNVTIRHGTIQGFMTGVALTASDLGNPGTTSYGHLVEELDVNACTYEGISVAGADSTVRSCQVENIGGSTVLDQLASAYGIDFLGAGLRCLDCDVSQVKASGTDGVSYGIYLSEANDAFVMNNRLSAAQYGLYFSGASGQYRQNLATGMLVQNYVGGTNAGTNIVDANGDGIDDDWELKYFGTLNINPNAAAPNGEGLTILQAYQQGINPVDFYAGQNPSLAIVSGSGQSAAPGSFLPAPLVVRVTDANGTAIIGAPVTFAVAAGGGQLQATRQGSPRTTVNVLTDANGQAQVFFQVASTTGTTSSINAFPTGTSPSNPQVFHETADSNAPSNPTPVDPVNPPTPQPVPEQSYAAIDVSGGVTPAYGDPVGLGSAVRLDDNNVVSFWTKAGDYGPFSAYVWKDGKLGTPQVTPGTIESSSYPDIAPYSMPLFPYCVLPTGELVGVCGDSVLPALGYTTGLFSAIGSNVTTSYPPLFFPDNPGAPVAVYTPSCVSDNGTVGGEATYDDSGPNFSYICSAGTYIAFDPAPDSPSDALPPATEGGWTQVGIDPLNFDHIRAVNNSGHALGDRESYTFPVTYWDGTKMVSVGLGFAAGLNEQDQAIVRGYYPDPAEGYLWENGNTTVLAEHLPAELLGEITQIEPVSISNQTAVGTDATIYILATANVTQPDGTVTNGATIVCTRDNDGDWSFAQVGVPDGTMVSQYTTINSSGTIAAEGSVSSDGSTPATYHTSDPSQSPSPSQHALSVPQGVLNLKYTASGSYNNQILYGYKSSPRGSIADNLGISMGGIWRDMQFVNKYTFGDGSTLTCTSGWLSDTPSRNDQGGGENGKLVWVDTHFEGDQPMTPANLFCDVSDVTSVSDDCYMRWFLVLYINNKPVPVSECDTHYLSVATGNNGALVWSASSSNSDPKFPKDSAAGAPAKFQPAQPRIEDESKSEAQQFPLKKRNWVASGGRAAQYLQQSNLQ